MIQTDDGGGRPPGRPLSYRVPLGAIVVVALVVRIGAIAVDSGYEPLQDSLDYDRHARSIAAGDGFPESTYAPGGGPAALRAPGYPIALGMVYAASGGDVGTGRVFGAALGALCVLLLFLVAREIWGERIGLLAAALAAVYPPLVALSTELYSENLFIPLLLAAVYAVLRYRESGMLRWAALAGALAGFVALTRGPGVVALLPLGLGLWMHRPAFTRRALAAPLIGLACAALVVAPWSIRNAVEFDRFVPIATSTGFGLAGTYNSVSRSAPSPDASWQNPAIVPEYAELFSKPGVDEATLDDSLRSESLGFLAAHPGYAFEVAGNNLLRLAYLQGGSVVAYGEEVVQPGIGNRGTTAEKTGLAIAAAFAALGIVAMTGRRRGSAKGGRIRLVPRGPIFLWLIPIALIAVALPVAGLPRYRVPADPFLLILAAIGLAWLVDASRGRRRRAKAAGVSVVAVALLCSGCGGTADESSVASAGSESEPLKHSGAPHDAYVARADRICREAIVEARKLVETRFAQESAGDPLQQTTEDLVAPGIRIRARQAARLRNLTPPEGQDANLGVFLGLFDSIDALSRLRLEAGRASDPGEARRIEALLTTLAFDQQQAARAYGFRDCSKDVIGEAFK